VPGLPNQSEGRLKPLLALSAYVFDFLCIHPFLDGNGRMSRLLTLLLLYKAGYGVGRFISLEKIVEQTREGYYDALLQSSQGWHEGKHSLVPWWEYLLGVVVQAVERLASPFRVRDVERMSPGVSRITINRVLQRLREEGKIRSLGKGRDAAWERVE